MDSQEGGFSQFLHKAASYVPDSSDSDRATSTHSEGLGRKLSSEGHGEKAPSEGHGEKFPSSSEALSSAKYLLDTAVSKLHKAESESGGDRPIDKAKIAAAAGDVLAAAKHYGKLDESKNGTYLQKAEDYLNKYGEENRTSSENSGVHTSAPHGASHESAPHAASHESAPHAASHESAPHTSSKSGSEDEENKYGEYFKQAESLFNKF